MSWLRLPDFDAGEPELVHDGDGNLVEVLVRCRPTKANTNGAASTARS